MVTHNSTNMTCCQETLDAIGRVGKDGMHRRRNQHVRWKDGKIGYTRFLCG